MAKELSECPKGDSDLECYLRQTEIAQSYWELCKSRSSWHFDYSRPEEEDRERLWRIIGRVELPASKLSLQDAPLLHRDDELPSSCISSEVSEKRRLGYAGWGYDVRQVKGALSAIGQSLPIKQTDVTLHIQRPGQVKWIHLDSMVSFARSAEIKSLRELQRVVRFFVMLTSWEPGHFIAFGNSVVPRWEAGDVIWFDWINAPHATANAGRNERWLLRVTGIPTPEADMMIRSGFARFYPRWGNLPGGNNVSDATLD